MSQESKKPLILIVEDEELLRSSMQIILEDVVSSEFKEVSNYAEALEFLSHSSPDLIISDYYIGANTGIDLYNSLGSNKNKIPFVLMSAFEASSLPGMEDFNGDNNVFLQKPDVITEIDDHVRHFLVNEQTGANAPENSDYGKISKRLLGVLGTKPAYDIYLKTSDTKYIRFFGKDEDDFGYVLSKLDDKGIDYVYMIRDDFKSFFLEVVASLYAKMEAPQTDNTSLDLSTIESIHTFVQSLGIAPQVVALADKQVTNIIESVKHNGLKSLLMKMINSRDYIFSHSIVLSYIATAFASELRWSETNIKKIIKASLIHDLCLDDHNMAKIDNLNHPHFLKLDRQSQKRVTHHMHDLFKLWTDLSLDDEDVKKMVIVHHERPDGSGFPRGLRGPQMNKTEATFIIAHFFADRVLRGEDIVSIVKEGRELFVDRNFKELFDSAHIIFRNEIPASV